MKLLLGPGAQFGVAEAIALVTKTGASSEVIAKMIERADIFERSGKGWRKSRQAFISAAIQQKYLPPKTAHDLREEQKVKGIRSERAAQIASEHAAARAELARKLRILKSEPLERQAEWFQAALAAMPDDDPRKEQFRSNTSLVRQHDDFLQAMLDVRDGKQPWDFEIDLEKLMEQPANIGGEISQEHA